jgi:hypothetical protein
MKVLSIILLNLLCVSFFSTSLETEAFIYYQTEDGIFGFEMETTSSTLITSDVSQTVAFSNAGHLMAYADSDGVWISPTEEWQPKNVISDLPAESFSLIWTPDDSRLILRLAFWPENMNPDTYFLSYNLIDDTAELWVWGQCDQIAQDNSTNDFALICTVYEELLEQEVTAVALQWGGNIVEYNEEQYTILQSGILDVFPPRYDWGVLNNAENLVVLDSNPDYQSDDDLSFWRIASFWPDGAMVEVTHGQPEIEQWFSISDDRSLLAYSVFCGQPSESCLQIINNSTGEIVWDFEDTVRVGRILDIAWYPDSQHIVVLGETTEGQDTLYIFDVEAGISTSFEVDDTTGIVAVN